MATLRNTHFLTWTSPLALLALVLTLAWHESVTGADENHLRGEVGGNVTFRCPRAEQSPIEFFYFQKGHVFVDGFHAWKNITKHWQNTRLDRNKTTVHMYNLTLRHSGDYQCHIMYRGGRSNPDTTLRLSVTAKYSKPEPKLSCTNEDHGSSCLVVCASHGGYPTSKMKWNVTGSPSWKVVNSSEMSDRNTLMVTSSSTAHFNCSNGEWEVSCSVGNLTSDKIPVCTPEDPPDANNHLLITAAACTAAVFTLSVIVVVLWRRKHKKGQNGGNATDGSVALPLNANRGEEQAP